MPSRNAASSPTSKKLKYKVDKVLITPERRVPKKKLEVHVNETSSPEAILHASWEFISAFYFFNTFKAYFHLPKSLSIDKLEQAMLAGKDDDAMLQPEYEAAEDEHAAHLKRESSVTSQQSNASGAASPQPARRYLANFMVHITAPLLTQRQKTLISADNYEQFVADIFPDFTHFTDMSVLDKIKVLKSIEMAHVEIGDPELVSLQNGQSGQELRFAPLGSDYEGWVYWYFGDDRLYREIPLPVGRKTVTLSDTREFTFELACSTIQDWRDMIEKFKPTKRTSNRDLASAISALGREMVAKLEAREEYRLRNEAKIKRARELELMPKKRSRRLEVKFDEQAKRQKLLDEVREQAELEEQERQKKAKEAKLAADRERKELQAQEIKLRKDMFAVMNNVVSQGLETEADMKPLRAPITLKTPQEERVHKMKGWIRLLRGTVSVELVVGEPQQVAFIGQNVDTALESVLFKNTMRIYLATLLLFKLNPIALAYEHTEEVHKKLVLSRYSDIDAFCQELNTAFESISDVAVREEAIGMLVSLFTLDSAVPTKESQETDTTKQDASVPEAVLNVDASSQPTLENTTTADPATVPTSDAMVAEHKADSIKPQPTPLDSQEPTADMSPSVPELASLPPH